jgi:protocatechuate 3,4-dioxygenase beta subunit
METAMDRRRRHTLQALALLATVPGLSRAQSAAAPALTPACDDGDAATPRQTEGPFFTPVPPARSSFLKPGLDGRVIVLQGLVLSADCRPIAGALVDVWHADAEGRYDNSGYRCRGHQFTDEAGGYRLETVVPGLYPGRTRHFHVKVQAPSGPVLTTQLYFPDEPANRRDVIFDRRLVLGLERDVGRFDFVVLTA